MKRKYLVLLLFLFIGLTACEDDIFPELEQVPPQMVVDAWINNLSEPQYIKLIWTQPYYEAITPPGVENAIIYITDNDGNRFDFIETSTSGLYEWLPTAQLPQFGAIGKLYDLTILTGQEILTSNSEMNRVPPIDSVNFRLENNNFISESYFAQFFARDPEGPGDTYWIKAYKNGVYLNKPDEINYTFDAGFSEGGLVDGVIFIQPIRDGINPFETDENDELISPYAPGDSVFVEIHSITNDAYVFLNELRIQTDRPGGFGELFATPLSNIPTNILNTNPSGAEVLGFFCVSAVSSNGAYLDPDNLPVE